MLFCAFSALSLMLTVSRLNTECLWVIPIFALMLIPFAKKLFASFVAKAILFPVCAVSFFLRCGVLFFQTEELSGIGSAFFVLAVCAVFWWLFFKNKMFFISAIPAFFLCLFIGIFVVSTHFFDGKEVLRAGGAPKELLASAVLCLSSAWVCGMFGKGSRASLFRGTVMGIFASLPFLLFDSGMSHSFAVFFSNLFFAGFELSALKNCTVSAKNGV